MKRQQNKVSEDYKIMAVNNDESKASDRVSDVRTCESDNLVQLKALYEVERVLIRLRIRGDES
jgi:hypothetical protein